MKILLGFVGLQVMKLMRTDFGAYSLGNLSPGEFREVHPIPLSRVKSISPFDFSPVSFLKSNLSAFVV